MKLWSILLLLITILCSSCELARYGHQVITETIWQENEGELPDPPDFGFEEIATYSKDLEKIGAINEEVLNEIIAEKLSSEFGLNEKRSYEISRLLVNWKRIMNRRAVTESDSSLFLNEVLGSSYSEVVDAITNAMNGDDSKYSVLIEKAARVNNVDPEHMNDIISEIFMN